MCCRIASHRSLLVLRTLDLPGYSHRFDCSPAINACLSCSPYKVVFFRLHYRHFEVFNILFLFRVREVREQLFCFLLASVAETGSGPPSQCGVGWLWFDHDWSISGMTTEKLYSPSSTATGSSGPQHLLGHSPCCSHGSFSIVIHHFMACWQQSQSADTKTPQQSEGLMQAWCLVISAVWEFNQSRPRGAVVFFSFQENLSSDSY